MIMLEMPSNAGLCLANASVSWLQSLVMRGLCLGTHNRFKVWILVELLVYT